MPARRSLGRRLLAERALLTVLASVALAGLIGAYYPRKTTGVPEQRHELMKLEWNHEADVVVAGDSRAAGGVSPEAMGSILPNLRILNFAFSNNGYSPEYLDAIERVLKPSSPNRTIVIGVTPVSLSAVQQTAGYLAAQRPVFTTLRWKYFGNFFAFFAPIKPWDLIDHLRGLSERGFYRVFHEDGWLSSRLVPAKAEFSLAKIEREYAEERIDAAVSDRLFGRIRDWTHRGIRVVGFRTPASERLLEVELKTGFDPKSFGEQWRNAGGIWVELPPRAWETYDGSHLVPEEAIILSRQLGEAILESTRTSTQ